MRKIFVITWLRLKDIFKTPSAWVMMLVMPLIFSIIFGGVSGGSERNKPVVNIVGGKDEASRQIVELLKANDQYKWVESSESKAKENIRAQEAAAAVIVPADLIERIEAKEPLFDVVVQRKGQEYTALYPYVEGAARTVFQSYSATSQIDSTQFPALLESVAASEGVTIEKEIVQKDEGTGEAGGLLSVGFTIMFMMFGISGAASAILDERAAGTWPRLLVTPATKAQIMIGYLLSYFIMGWIQLAVLMTGMKLIFGANWGNLAYFIPFASLAILSIVGFGLMMAGLVKTRQQAGAVSAVLIVSTCMLGGVYWPLDIVPEMMRQIAKAVPQSWMMTGFREIISGSLYSPAMVQAVLALIGFSAVFFIIGLKKMKFR
ncbi:ABC transporter permease [Bacillus sp. T33-2]|uniref:ABC transporter permease n=1 Tax=Bacillus sp. T33-2 TaxID=2054168 RepID=UPI000C774C7E|nr:ABC transporter permease [Bacillus sp. T33-2]PLR94685.1 ABC transporter permease [Bacillus sp. T33-2]